MFSFCRNGYWRFSSWHFYFWVNTKFCLFVSAVFPITLSSWALRIKALFFCTQVFLHSVHLSSQLKKAVELHRAFSSCLVLILSTLELLEKSTARKSYSLERNDVRHDPGRYFLECPFRCFGKHLWQFLAPDNSSRGVFFISEINDNLQSNEQRFATVKWGSRGTEFKWGFLGDSPGQCQSWRGPLWSHYIH